MNINLGEFTKAVAYYRVSTDSTKQEHGIDAQRRAVETFAENNGLELLFHDIDGDPLYIEYETGTKKRHRPILSQAMAAAHEQGAVLLIAKLDRLSRNVAFISSLMETRVNFVAVDMPNVDTFTLHLLAAFAEREAKIISERTKAGLAVARAKGRQIGSPDNLTDYSRERALASRQTAAMNYYNSQLISDYITLRREGGASWGKIANGLNERGKQTRRGNSFTRAGVAKIHKQILAWEAMGTA